MAAVYLLWKARFADIIHQPPRMMNKHTSVQKLFFYNEFSP